MLWIALHLPLISLESFAATCCREALPEGSPVAIALLDAQRIAMANAAAQALGIKPGLKRATALALAPQLVLGQADIKRDWQSIEAVAHIALAFTPNVVIQPSGDGATGPKTVVLEVERCLRYFGGIDTLHQRLHKALSILGGHRIHCVSAPTAQGAALLACVHPKLRCADRAALHAALDDAPVWLLGPGREHWEALQGMGLRTLADLRRLPRAGIARRFGEALLGELDRARGEAPDPRKQISLPERFDSRLELFARADTTEQVLQGASVLLARLTAWLSAQHAQVRRFTLVMHHEVHRRRETHASTATPLTISLAEPSRDPTHLLVLLREHLARVSLSAPTLELQMQADEITHRALPNGELFPTPSSEAEGLIRLIERLQARLGHEHVKHLVLLSDHRPERGSPARALPVGAGQRVRSNELKRAKRASPPRPVWLLSRPEPLREHQSRPWLDGQPLQLLSGPERIESGWWDAGLAERDYFIAQIPSGALVWIYRVRLLLSETPEPGWFLQGRFA